MKRKNAGLSTVEIIVTAVIVVLVIAGVLIAVKFSGKEPTDDGNEAKSKELAETLIAKVEDCTKNADVDIIIDGQGYSKFIGSNKYQVFYMDAASKKVYFIEKSSSELGADAKEMREKAKDLTYAPEEMELLQSDVVIFLPELVNAASLEGALKVVSSVKVGDATNPVTKSIPLNKSAIEYFAEKANVDITVPTESPTPTPDQPNTPTPTKKPDDPTPTPTKPADTPTPEPTPKELEEKVEHKTPTTGTNTLDLVLNTMVTYKKKQNVVVRIVITRTQEDTTNMKGSTIGGLCLDSGTPADGYFFTLKDDYDLDQEFYFEYPFELFTEFKDDYGIRKVTVKVNSNSGYTLQSVDIHYWE